MRVSGLMGLPGISAEAAEISEGMTTLASLPGRAPGPGIAHQSRVSGMPISRSRDVRTTLCHSSTSICQLLEYGSAGAGVPSEGGLGSSGDPLGQAGEVAAQPCSSAAQLTQRAIKVLLGRSVALTRGLEIGKCIVQSFLESVHVRDGLARALQFGAGLLVPGLFDLQPVALGLHPPGTGRADSQGCPRRDQMRVDGWDHGARSRRHVRQISSLALPRS